LVDEYHITYEYTAGNTITFKSNDLKVREARSHLRIDTRVDGTRVVTDPGHTYKIFTFSSIISGATMDSLDTVQSGVIDYTGAYPRVTVLYWNGTTTETNIEVAITDLVATDLGSGWWHVAVTMEEKDQ
jgi:hypothetical protein